MQAHKKILVLISGSGTNLQAFIDAQTENKIDAEIVAVISNKEDAFGLERAKLANIPTHIVSHKSYPTRLAFDQNLAKQIDSYQPDLIILAGFMRILTPWFADKYQGKLLNIHPSLLPKYPGLNTHKRALDNQDEFHGSSVHFVTQELDGGPLIAQSKTKILKDDTQASLTKRVLTLEHKLYPYVAKLFIEERIKLEQNQVVCDDEILDKPIEV